MFDFTGFYSDAFKYDLETELDAVREAYGKIANEKIWIITTPTDNGRRVVAVFVNNKCNKNNAISLDIRIPDNMTCGFTTISQAMEGKLKGKKALLDKMIESVV